MGWEDAPIVQVAPKRQAWEDAPIVYPTSTPNRDTGGTAPSTSASEPSVMGRISRAWTAGYQGSLAGLADRGKLPDVVLDPQHSKWYERAVSGLSQIVNETPESIAGVLAGGAAGSLAGPIGTLLGAGAGAFAVPAAIRESLIQAYSKGAVTSSADFLGRTAIVLKAAGKEGLIGAATAGAGKAAQVGAAAAGLGTKGTVAAVTSAELGALVVTPAALEGRMPEPQDFVDAAVLLVGLKGATAGARKIADIYAKTGKTPIEVVADAQRDPTIVEDLRAEAPEVAPVAAEPVKRATTEPAYDPEARVSVQAFDAQTGAMAETTLIAKDALADNARRSEQMKGLLKCLGG